MNLAKLLEELREDRVRPAYLLAGAEPLLRDDALDALEEAVLGDGSRDFNLDRMEVGGLSLGRFEEALQSLPFMSKRRLVILRETEGRRGKLDARLAEAIETWLSSADLDSPVVLIVAVSKADKRSKWVKAFKEPAALVECEAPTRSRDLAAFLKDEAARQGVELDPDAAGLLAERIGPQLLLLRQEIEKAALFAGLSVEGSAVRVERSHVEQTVATVAEESIWDLTDAIGQGQTADAINQLARILDQGAAPPAVLGALASHFRRLVRVGHGERIAGAPYVVHKLEQQARRYPRRRLIVCLRAIHRADVELKGVGVLRPERALEQLVLGLAS
jgi:DNA polymerase-3 subunit delta